MPATLFISDLHLDPDRPAIAGLFLKFLEQQALKAEDLYILGDLFETWIGDDNDSEFNRSITDGLNHLVRTGTPVYVMHGNRDFLMGKQFEETSGCKLLPDPTTIDLYGQSVLLMHGDTLCTDDVAYMTFREQVRDPEWQQSFLGKSLAERKAIADGLREISQTETSGKSEDIMDVNTDEVIRILEEFNTGLLIHGHTHRPGTHKYHVRGKDVTRIVLGDWYEQGSVLVVTDQGYNLKILQANLP
jgi:UDP-2,3-diacylglucosamine hydrolase